MATEVTRIRTMVIMKHIVLLLLLLLQMTTANQPSLTSLLTIWNVGAQRCLGFGYFRKQRERPFVKRGSGAEASLDVCHVHYGPSGVVQLYTLHQLLNLTLTDTPSSNPKGNSTKFYGLSTPYHQCIFVTDDLRPRLLTSDQAEDCRSDHDVVQLVIPNDDWRYGAWIATPVKGNLTQVQCLTALEPTLDEAQVAVQFDDCSVTDRNQRWHVCNIEVQNCTSIMKSYF